LDLEVNCQVTKQKTKNNLENGEEYVGITKTPYWNMMLDRQVLRIEERHVVHMSFLPQEVVRCEIWIGGL
jgi:heterodisulfide reductase subunit B